MTKYWKPDIVLTMPLSGRISCNDINTELGKTGPRSIGASDSRDLAKVPSGPIKLSDFYGKSSIPPFPPTGNDVYTGNCPNGGGTAWYVWRGNYNHVTAVVGDAYGSWVSADSDNTDILSLTTATGLVLSRGVMREFFDYGDGTIMYGYGVSWVS